MPKTFNSPGSFVLRSLVFVLLGTLAGCSSTPQVGAVVVANRVQLPPVPSIVLETLPAPAGWFQQQEINRLSTQPSTPSGSAPTK